MLAVILAFWLLDVRPAPEVCECTTDADCEAECDGRICGGALYCDGWCAASSECP